MPSQVIAPRQLATCQSRLFVTSVVSPGMCSPVGEASILDQFSDEVRFIELTERGSEQGVGRGGGVCGGGGG